MHEIEEELMDGFVEELYRALVAALRRSREDPFAAPVTVAEIYQDLVPYREVRGQLGFEMNADYEHTLLRLLAGEGELARIDPVEAGDELRDELRSPNPNVGMFRKFAGCDVWVTPASDALPPVTTFAFEPEAEPATDMEAEPGVGVDASGSDSPDPWQALETVVAEEREAELLHWSESNGNADADPLTELVPDPPAPEFGLQAILEEEQLPEYDLVPRVRSRTTAAADHPCAFCGAGLPSGRTVLFCPHCGSDQSQRPCGSCGETLDAQWRFCIACGTAAGAPT
jgi:hypothetical protein